MPDALVERIAALDTCAVSDALDHLGLRGATVGLRPLWACPKIAGRAVTVKVIPAGVTKPAAHLATPAIEAAIRQRGVDQLVFGSEAPGSGTSVKNPETGRPSDDLVPVLERMTFLSADDRRKILHDNVLRVFPRLVSRLRAGEPARA